MALKITTIGEVLVDLTQTSIDGNGIVNFAANPGGAPANVAVAASRLGALTAFIGCIGKDSFGESLKRTLAANNVCIDGLQKTARWHIIFHGKVQHVGFRYTSLYFCRKLKLTGWVRNLGRYG